MEFKTYFVYFHTFSCKLKVQRTPTEFGVPVVHIFSERKFDHVLLLCNIAGCFQVSCASHSGLQVNPDYELFWIPFHLPRNSGNSGWDFNGTHVFRVFHAKIPDDERNFEKVVLFSRWKLSGRNAYFIYEFTPEITSSRLSMAIYLCHHLEI